MHWSHAVCLTVNHAFTLKPPPPTSAVPEVPVRGRVVLAEALQDLLVVREAVQRAQQEHVEGDVAHLLQLKVPAHVLQPAGGPARLVQVHQGLRLALEVSCQGLEGG